MFEVKHDFKKEAEPARLSFFNELWERLRGASHAELEQIGGDPLHKELKALKGRECFVGAHNEDDVRT